MSEGAQIFSVLRRALSWAVSVAAGGLVMLMPSTLPAQSAQRTVGDIASAYSSGFDMCLEALRTDDIRDYTLQQRRENNLRAAYAARRVGETDLLVVVWNNAEVEWDSTEIVSCKLRMRGSLDLSDRVAMTRWVTTMQDALAAFQGVEELPPRSRPIWLDTQWEPRRFAWCEDDRLPFIATLGRFPTRPIDVEITLLPTFDEHNPCELE